MGYTVTELLDRLSSSELTEWLAYEQVAGPLGRERDDVLATMVTHRLLAAFGAKPKMRDLLPQWDQPPTQDPGHMQHLLEALTLASGGTVQNGSR